MEEILKEASAEERHTPPDEKDSLMADNLRKRFKADNPEAKPLPTPDDAKKELAVCGMPVEAFHRLVGDTGFGRHLTGQEPDKLNAIRMVLHEELENLDLDEQAERLCEAVPLALEELGVEKRGEEG
jgi:hypothetical protein